MLISKGFFHYFYLSSLSLLYIIILGFFEKRVMDYRVEMKQLTNPLRENVKDIGKRIVGFLRDYGEYTI